MADKVYFNLSEEIEQEIVNSYSTMLDDLTQRLHTLNDSLMDLCSRVKYAPMVSLVNNTIEMFDEDIRQVAQTTFEEWLDGVPLLAAISLAKRLKVQLVRWKASCRTCSTTSGPTSPWEAPFQLIPLAPRRRMRILKSLKNFTIPAHRIFKKQPTAC